MIHSHLEQQSEPRSATEISAALTKAHPDRGVKTTVVRTTLEGLVAKSQAQRTKQGSSVFYTATAASEAAAADSQREAVAS
ncbi:BlaI/MecI/CopY family transcriptional regulator [Streptomyces sp. NPDC056831]|uniref:BlaI/MecI/CopY family transcriptional regulator n=1 Tax=Streptomyces sp. NPDC056831 TaxID=3345954 RepID=UPI00368D84A7